MSSFHWALRSFCQDQCVFFVKLRTHTSENSCYHTLRRGSTKCENSNTCTRITNHELVECHTVSIYAWYQMIGHVVQSRNQFPHLCVQVFKLPVTICQLWGHSTQTSTLPIYQKKYTYMIVQSVLLAQSQVYSSYHYTRWRTITSKSKHNT